ncbi:MAG TPA: RAMP superfamily CRISPR-associated protein [Candidatus Wallbacteria bacterium]|nr:RAMP superfamily CRISPR-associated protein [Candidatus Wallbacteria bacterium]
MINSEFNIKYSLEGTLVFHSSFFTAASMELDPVIDMCILKTPDKKLLLGGSTLAGKIRSTLENIFGENDERIRNIFGFQDASSRIIFNDSIAENSLYEERYGVVIDRNTGTAADGLLYDKQIAPPYIKFKVRVDLDSSEARAAGDLEILRLIEKLLAEGFINFGGNASRGSGFCFLRDHFIRKALLTEEKGFISYILDKMEKTDEKHELSGMPVKGANGGYSSILLEYELKFDQGVLTGDKTNMPGLKNEDLESDIMPYFMTTPEGEYFIIPGSSLKGVLRTKAESILLKRKFKYICDPSATEGYCNDNYRYKGKSPDALCEACKIFGAVDYASKVLFSDLIMNEKVSDSQLKKVEHVAIDRFTGGGIEGCKFNETIVEKPVYKGYAVVRNPSLSDMNILAHLALEMNDGKIRAGHSTRKGFGRLMPRLLSAKVFTSDPENDVISALSCGAAFKNYGGAEFIEAMKKHLNAIEDGRKKANE